MTDTTETAPAAPPGVLVTITPRSPHAFAWRVFLMRPNDTAWTVLDSGNCGDGRPVSVTGPLMESGSKVSVWMGIGGAPGSSYRIDLSITNGGRPVPGGLVQVVGQTSNAGGADEERRVSIP